MYTLPIFMGGRKSHSFCSTEVQVISKSLCHSETQQSDSLVKMSTTFFPRNGHTCDHMQTWAQNATKDPICWIWKPNCEGDSFKVTVIIRSRAVIENQASPEGFA